MALCCASEGVGSGKCRMSEIAFRLWRMDRRSSAKHPWAMPRHFGRLPFPFSRQAQQTQQTVSSTKRQRSSLRALGARKSLLGLCPSVGQLCFLTSLTGSGNGST
jgi:hypothetical protein